jgi:hypothetical protein
MSKNEKNMGKYSAINKLSKSEQQELFIDFATALASIKNPIEAASFVKDLLSEGEVIMLAAGCKSLGCCLKDILTSKLKKP